MTSRTTHLSTLAAIALLAVAPARAFEIEVGTVNVQDTFAFPAVTNVTFIQSFPTTPVVVALPTNDGGDPSTLRITNVTPSGFSILQVEPNGNDGPHVAMNTAYLAVELGDHLLPDGSRMQAYGIDTTATVGRFTGTTWLTLNFASNFSGTPAVLAALQTDVNESGNPPSTSSIPFLNPAIRNVGSTSLQYSMELAETTAGSVTSNETLGIVAMTSGVDLSVFDYLGTSVRIQSLRSSDSIRGWDDGCYPISWPSAFSATPLSIATMNSRDGNNGGWIRRCGESASALSMTVDEDIDADTERNHTTEIAGMFGASAAFHADMDPDIDLSVDVTTISDPVGAGVGPFNIPGSIVRYTMTVSNEGNGIPDTSTLVITDTLQNEIALCVTAACNPGGPVILDDTASPTPTGVTLGTVRYSEDGDPGFGYSPTPDGDGFDMAVDAIEVTLNGDFQALAAAGAPEVQILLIGRVD